MFLSEAQKYHLLLAEGFFFIIFPNVHIHNVVSSWPNVFQIKDEIDSVDSTLLNVISTLI